MSAVSNLADRRSNAPRGFKQTIDEIDGPTGVFTGAVKRATAAGVNVEPTWSQEEGLTVALVSDDGAAFEGLSLSGLTDLHAAIGAMLEDMKGLPNIAG